jgi:hypothetical protein
VAVITFLVIYFETGKGYASIMHTLKILCKIVFLSRELAFIIFSLRKSLGLTSKPGEKKCVTIGGINQGSVEVTTAGNACHMSSKITQPIQIINITTANLFGINS